MVTHVLLQLLLLAASSTIAWSVACFSNTTARAMLQSVNLTGEVFLITGGDGHIATQVNLALLGANATLVLACYSADKCTAAAQSLVAATGVDPGHVSTQQVDLSSKASIRALAARVSSLLGAGTRFCVEQLDLREHGRTTIVVSIAVASQPSPQPDQAVSPA